MSRLQRGQTLIATLIVVAIILILVVLLMKGSFGGLKSGESPRKDKLGTTIPGLAKYAAKDDVCRSDLGQCRTGIQLFHTTNGDEGWPASLNELHLGNDMTHCPVGHEAYVYDPSTGQVHCPHPGHEKY